MVMLAKIRRMHFRDGMSVREVSRRTGLSVTPSAAGCGRAQSSRSTRHANVLASSMPTAISWRFGCAPIAIAPKRDRRTAKVLFHQLQAQGFPGGYGRVAEFVRRWRAGGGVAAAKPAFVPLQFSPGDAFQFDWICEYAMIGGLRCRLEVAHVKLAASRVFWLVAYPAQSHEMLFDAHARAFAAFGGVPRRGLYDNMKTAVDRIGRPSAGTPSMSARASPSSGSANGSISTSRTTT